MWKFGKEDEKPATSSSPARPAAATPVVAPKPAVPTPQEAYSVEPSRPVQNYRAEVAHIGKSVVIKGELSGSEDLYLDGEVEGSIELRGHSITVGPNGRVRANVHARDIIVHGKVDGNLHGSERVELKKSGVLIGDIFTQRIAIEDGAYFKGGIDIQKPETKPEQKVEPKPDTRSAVAAAVQAHNSSSQNRPVSSGSQAPLIETKK
ncbi:MAG TPA: polymer-forming cytoskeletal protein [Terriglobales bacterium]|nr:polymer-forming cytoskeletal protein [Terriglobales bacterium]